MILLKTGFRKVAILAALALAALTVAPRAEASTLFFSLTGDYTASWTLDSNPSPNGSSNADGYTFFSGVPGVDPLLLVFYSSTLGFGSGGLRISTTPDPLTEVGSIVDLAGDQIYSGLLSAPVFTPGVFHFNFDFLTNAALATPTTLTVSAIPIATTPIPAALPLFLSALAGMGWVGWRRRHSVADA
ncbi:hypothetical protein [Dongia sp. agr-C8]